MFYCGSNFLRVLATAWVCVWVWACRRGSTQAELHRNVWVCDTCNATICSYVVTRQPKKYPVALCISQFTANILFMKISWNGSTCAFFCSVYLPLKARACKTITNITYAPGKPFFALFLQREVITVRSSLLLPENQPKFPIASGHEFSSLGACHLIRTERRMGHLK